MNKVKFAEIRCQGTACKKNGCSTCGGYGVVVLESACRVCQRRFWVRPGVHTVYDGKTYRTFDGLEMVWRKEGSLCLSCDKTAPAPVPKVVAALSCLHCKSTQVTKTPSGSILCDACGTKTTKGGKVYAEKDYQQINGRVENGRRQRAFKASKMIEPG